MSTPKKITLDTDAIIADTAHLSAHETGAHLLLLMMASRTEAGVLPNVDHKLARWARLDRRTWRSIKPRLEGLWVCAGDKFVPVQLHLGGAAR